MNKLKNIESLITSGEKLGLAKGYDVCNKEEIMKEIKELIEEIINKTIKIMRSGDLAGSFSEGCECDNCNEMEKVIRNKLSKL